MNRRRFLTLAGLAAAATGTIAGLRSARANAYYSGPVSDHFDGTKFFNPSGATPNSFGSFLKWQFGESSATWPERFESPHPRAMPPAMVAGSRLRATFIGHASFLLQTDGRNILVDPHFSERASPVRFAGPKRINPPGIRFEDLPRIDAVLVSHNHYDHLDLSSLHRLWDAHRPRIITPLGNDAIIRADRPDIPVETGDWGAAFDIGRGLAVTIEPAQHWSARGAFDRMHALWGSFVIESRWGKAWFAGDTGLGDGSVFRGIKARHPLIHLGLIPIGAYEPRWFMRHQHVNPEDAVEIARILSLRHALGYHWGTFKLTNEAIDQPPTDLAHALEGASIKAERFIAMRPGGVWQAS